MIYDFSDLTAHLPLLKTLIDMPPLYLDGTCVLHSPSALWSTLNDFFSLDVVDLHRPGSTLLITPLIPGNRPKSKARTLKNRARSSKGRTRAKTLALLKEIPHIDFGSVPSSEKFATMHSLMVGGVVNAPTDVQCFAGFTELNGEVYEFVPAPDAGEIPSKGWDLETAEGYAAYSRWEAVYGKDMYLDESEYLGESEYSEESEHSDEGNCADATLSSDARYHLGRLISFDTETEAENNGFYTNKPAPEEVQPRATRPSTQRDMRFDRRYTPKGRLLTEEEYNFVLDASCSWGVDSIRSFVTSLDNYLPCESEYESSCGSDLPLFAEEDCSDYELPTDHEGYTADYFSDGEGTNFSRDAGWASYMEPELLGCTKDDFLRDAEPYHHEIEIGDMEISRVVKPSVIKQPPLKLPKSVPVVQGSTERKSKLRGANVQKSLSNYKTRVSPFWKKVDKITYIRYVFIFATDMKKLQMPFTSLPTPLRVQYKSYKNSSYFLTVDNDTEKLFYAYPGKWELAVKARRKSYTLMLGWWSFVFNSVLQRYYGISDQLQVPLLNVHFSNLNNRILKYFFFVQDVSTYWPNTHIVITIDYNLYQFVYVEKKSRYMKKYKLKNRYGADRAFRRDNWAPIVF